MVPFFPPLTDATIRDYANFYITAVSAIIVFGGVIAPVLEVRLGLGGACPCLPCRPHARFHSDGRGPGILRVISTRTARALPFSLGYSREWGLALLLRSFKHKACAGCYTTSVAMSCMSSGQGLCVH